MARPIFSSVITFPSSWPLPPETTAVTRVRKHVLSQNTSAVPCQKFAKAVSTAYRDTLVCSILACLARPNPAEHTAPISDPFGTLITGTVIRYLSVLLSNNSSRRCLINFRPNFLLFFSSCLSLPFFSGHSCHENTLARLTFTILRKNARDNERERLVSLYSDCKAFTCVFIFQGRIFFLESGFLHFVFRVSNFYSRSESAAVYGIRNFT